MLIAVQVPFVCSYSPVLKIAASVDAYRETLERIALETAQVIASDEKIAASLKVPKLPGSTLLRQSDIRATADGPIILTTFVCWSDRHNCWHVLIESANENHWERAQLNERMN